MLFASGTNLRVLYYNRKDPGQSELVKFLTLVILRIHSPLVNLYRNSPDLSPPPSSRLKHSFLQLLRALVTKSSQVSFSPETLLVRTKLATRSLLSPVSACEKWQVTSRAWGPALLLWFGTPPQGHPSYSALWWTSLFSLHSSVSLTPRSTYKHKTSPLDLFLEDPMVLRPPVLHNAYQCTHF